MGSQTNTQSLFYKPVYDSTTTESIVEGIVKTSGNYTREGIDPGGYVLSNYKFLVNPIPRMSGYLYLPTRVGESYVDRHVRIRGVVSQEQTPGIPESGPGHGSVFSMRVKEIIIVDE